MQELIKLIECPVTFEPFKKPMITNVGQTYESDAISEHMQFGRKNDPLTAEPITQIVPNKLVEKLTQKILAIDVLLSQQQKQEIKDLLTCPITKKLFKNPVVTDTGDTYDLSALVKNEKQQYCYPATMEPITFLARNILIISLLDAYQRVTQADSNESKNSKSNADHASTDTHIAPKPSQSSVALASSNSFFPSAPKKSVNKKPLLVYDFRSLVLLGITDTLNVFDRNCQNLDLHLLQSIGMNTQDLKSLINEFNSPKYDATNILQTLYGIMSFYNPSKWHDTSIQQCFIKSIAIRTGVAPILDERCSDLPKNTDVYAKLWLGVMNSMAKQHQHDSANSNKGCSF